MIRSSAFWLIPRSDCGAALWFGDESFCGVLGWAPTLSQQPANSRVIARIFRIRLLHSFRCILSRDNLRQFQTHNDAGTALSRPQLCRTPVITFLAGRGECRDGCAAPRA